MRINMGWRNRDRLRGLRERWPLVSRRWHNRDRAQGIRAAVKCAEDELAKAKEALDPIIQKGTRIRAGMASTPIGETYRCQVEFDPYLMRQMFYQGDSQFAMRIIAERLAYQVEAEIKRINWHRFSEDEEAHRQARGYYPERRPSFSLADSELPTSEPPR